MGKHLSVFYLSLISILFFGCAEEQNFVHENTRKENITIKEVELKELLEQADFKSAFSKLVKNNGLINSLEARTQLEEQFGFTIADGVPAKVIESSKAVTYTFLIRRDIVTDEFFENLVITVDSIDRKSAEIIKYNLTSPIAYIPAHDTYFFESNKEYSTIFNERMSAGMTCVEYVFPMCSILVAGGSMSQPHHSGTSDGCQVSFYVSELICFPSSVGGSGMNESVVTILANAGGNDGGAGGPGSESTINWNDPRDPEDLDHDHVVTVPVLEFKDNLPCESLKKLTTTSHSPQHPLVNNSTILYPNLALADVKYQVQSGYEHGYSLKNYGDYHLYGSVATKVPATTTNHVYFPSHGLQFGTIHTHPDGDEYVPMFSHDDLYTLLSIKNTYSPSNPEGDDLFVCVLIVEQAGQIYTYAIKIENFANLSQLQALHSDKKKWDKFGDKLFETYKEIGAATASSNDFQKAFLKFIGNNNLGLSLYEMKTKNEGTPQIQNTWTKLTLDADNQLKPEPCN